MYLTASFHKRVFLCVILSTLPLAVFSQGFRGGDEPPLDHSRLELPVILDKDIILVYTGFNIKYNPEYLIPDWVAYELTSEEVNGEIPRAPGFSMDPRYQGMQAMREDYSYSGWDKGHMAPSADMKWSRSAMSESFYLTNICPQNHDLNGRDWHTLENRVRNWALKYGRIWIICGPIVTDKKYGTIGERAVMVPDRFFKAILRQDADGSFHAIAFVFENDSSHQPLNNAVISVDSLEAQTSLNLFTNLEDSIESFVEAHTSWNDWQ